MFHQSEPSPEAEVRLAASITRRSALVGLGSVGAAATFGAGVVSLLGASSAGAAEGSVLTVMSSSGPLKVVANGAAPAGCCECTCVIDEYTCPGHETSGCGTGSCCYHCTGCGKDTHICIGLPCTPENETIHPCSSGV